MKKVLIADDELLVRIGLKSTIPWEANGFLVVGEAKNGKEALELFEQYDPDILLTDIRMPIIDGLELIQKLKSRKSTLKAIILTHYDDFNYAKQAIGLGASEYILKSDLTPENILPVLNKLSDEIDSSIISDSYYKNGESNSVESDIEHSVYTKMFLESIATGDYNSIDELRYMLIKSNICFKYDCFVFACAQVFFNFNDNSIKEKKQELLKNTVENISKLVFGENISYHLSFINKNNIIYLFNIQKDSDYQINKRLFELFNTLKKNLLRLLDADMTVGVSTVGHSIEAAHELYKQANIALEKSFFESSGITVFDISMYDEKDDRPEIELETLRSYVQTLDIKSLDSYIEEIFDQLLHSRNVNCVKDVFIDFLSQVRILASELSMKNNMALSESKLNYSSFEELRNFEAVKKYILDLFRELIYNPEDNKNGKYSYVISKCIEFIKENYNKNIMLADAAEYVNISKSYLSLLFKQETGINFSSFLTNYRIEKSKKLLKESNYKIYEIAEKVGFDNPYYFSKVFKETVGVTCKEYKKLSV